MRSVIPRKALLLLFALVVFGLFWADAGRAEVLLRDAAGREVRLAKPAERIVTNESLLLLELALIDRDPVSKLAGWAAPRRLDRGIYARFRQRFPAIDSIPVVGGVVPPNTNIESLLSVDPDLFVVSLWDPGWEEISAGLEAAGVPTIFLDAPGKTTSNPAEAVGFSVELLGKAIGREAQANEFSAYMLSHYRAVVERLSSLKDRPLVLIDAFAGTECCSTPGRGNRLTEYLHLAGAKSVGEDVIPGYDGRVSPEAVIGEEPSVYVGTGGPHLSAQDGLVLGGKINPESARASLQAVLSQGVRRELKAVREGRAYGISHQLSISALSILAFECFAKWTHPVLFADLSPEQTLADINQRFLAVPLEGTFWIELRSKP
ncbi:MULTISPECIES: ABC transporter substrate-binding protein [unclassified Sinorhizobium]|uniref:ABC transporter substrate-binding protein n=1 Tax=unclassified Sinorhizobium TaxID=2613772 RepID=UPI003526386B